MPFHQIPFVRLLIPLCVGIITASYSPSPISSEIIFALVVSSLFSCLSFCKILNPSSYFRWIPGIAYTSLLVLIGYSISILQIEKYAPTHFDQFKQPQSTYQAKIIDDPVRNQKTTKVKLEIFRIHTPQDSVYDVTGKCIAYIENDSLSSYAMGDQIIFKSNMDTIPPPLNPHEFNYKRYLFHHHIYHRTYIPKSNIEISPSVSVSSIKTIAILFRQQLLTYLSRYNFEDNEYAILSALTLGKKDYLEDDLTKAYASAGAMHVLAVSGLHVGIVFLLLNGVLRFPTTKSYFRFSKAIILILGIWSFAFISGLSASVIRASTMFSFMIVAKALYKNSNIYNTLALSAFIILIFKPFMLMEVGFQLSYLAVLGIVYLQPKIARIWTPKHYIIKKAWEITCVSIAAQIATAPLGFLYFHQFPNYFLFSNLVVIPAAFAILILGISILVFHSIPIVSSALAYLLSQIIQILNTVVKWIDQLPYALSEGIDISVLETWLIYSAIITLSIVLFEKKKYWLFPSLSLVIILLFIQIQENQRLDQYNSIVFYQVKKETPIDFITNDQHYLLSSEHLLKNESKMLFHIKHHWWHLNSPESNPDLIYCNQDSSLIQFKEKTVFLLKENSQFPTDSIEVNYLYINHYSKKKHLKIKADTVIIGNGIWKKQKQRILDRYANTPIHDLSEKGALEVIF